MRTEKDIYRSKEDKNFIISLLYAYNKDKIEKGLANIEINKNVIIYNEL